VNVVCLIDVLVLNFKTNLQPNELLFFICLNDLVG